MNPIVNETQFQMKYARIIPLLAARLGISPQRALDIFYQSATYQHMSQQQYHLHNMSDHYLADDIMLELQARQ